MLGGAGWLAFPPPPPHTCTIDSTNPTFSHQMPSVHTMVTLLTKVVLDLFGKKMHRYPEHGHTMLGTEEYILRKTRAKTRARETRERGRERERETTPKNPSQDACPKRKKKKLSVKELL